ncbi:hypothetical protein QYE76_002052 [Lolium multiflorum]|uniref:Reverse transcriptase Ty1/copia-type domain-containing protein n=1 Tax=Lolium multiflorum TaxID=4521 RepID=A0AAD8VXX1_LOLMU|nr:hypothetical protein QYE76_002052 [Lolium multiflorum]
MGDINNTHGDGGVAAGATFPVAMYVLFLSYLALLLVPCSDLMHVLSPMCVVKYACASVMLLSNKTLLWLTAMGVHRVAEGIPRGPLTPEEDKAFGDATVIFVGAVLSVLGDKLVDAYLHIRNGKLWDALDAKFGAADGGELYAMERFNDYRMVENRSVVEQAHEIQIMAKELELLKFLVVKSGVDDMNVGTIFESRDATFFEDIFPMRDMHGMSSWESDPIHETPMESDEESDDESSDSDEDDNEAPTRSKRQRTAKSFGNDFIVYLVDDTPLPFQKLSHLDADYWKEAVQSEMDSILANGTWELTERPGCKPVGCKWVFKKKLRADGTIEKYKARLVPKGRRRFL